MNLCEFCQLVASFTIIPAKGEEKITDNLPPDALVVELAKQKAEEIVSLPEAKEKAVLGADTVVVLDGEILGKPKDRADAERMLLNLSGKVHKVVTGCTVVKNDATKSFSVVSRVKFQKLTKAEIDTYLDTDEPYDKAGSYAVQGKAGAFVEWIKGDYFNIVGLPIAQLKKYI